MIKNNEFILKKTLEEELGISLDNKYGVVTFHPVTLKENSSIKQFEQHIGAYN